MFDTVYFRPNRTWKSRYLHGQSLSLSDAIFGIKLRQKQKCFGDSCIPFYVGKQAADLSRFKTFFFKSNRKKIQIRSQIESRSFESNLYSLNRISKGAEIAIKSQSRLEFAHHWSSATEARVIELDGDKLRANAVILYVVCCFLLQYWNRC